MPVTMNPLSRLFFLACLAAAPALAQPLTTQPLDRVIAVVDEEIILQSELDRALNAIQQQYAASPQQLPPADVLARQVLDRIILGKLQAQRALDTGIRVSEVETDNAIAAIAQQNGMNIDQLRYALQQDGLSYGQFRESLREELLIQRLQERFAQGRVGVSETEIDNLLASSRDQSMELHLGHILVAVPDGADAATIRLGQEKADGVLDLVRNSGMDFAAAAIRYSDAPNALDGGDLGWRDINELPPAFAELAASLRDDEVSPAIRGPGGFHIVKLHGRRTAGPRLIQEYRARHIMIGVDELTSESQAQAQINQLHQRIVDGADFADLAREHSDDHSTGPLGGDMGWFEVNAYGDAVARLVQQMGDDEVSQPFQTDVGWHVMQRLGSRQQDVTERYERHRAAQIIRNRKAEEEYGRFLRQMRAEAYIENRLTSAGG